MVGRVTNLQTTLAFIDQIFQQRVALDRAREEVGSGIRVSSPSDDPSRAATISEFQSAKSRLERHKERISQVTSNLENQESVLGSVESLLLRARELGTQGANETVSAEIRQSMAAEVFQIRDTLVNLANSKYQGIYVYGGAADSTPPFVASTYTEPASASDPAHTRWVFSNATGATLTRTVALSDTDSVRLNSSGDTVFSSAIASVERLGRSLQGYRTDPEDLSTLPTGTGAAYNPATEYHVQTQAILLATDAVESARNNDIVGERTNIGARINAITRAAEIVDSVKLSTEKARSGIQDIDIFEAASRLSTLQTSLEGLLASGAQINNLSLLNFL